VLGGGQQEEQSGFAGVHPVLVVGVSLAPLEGHVASHVEPPVVSPVEPRVASHVEPPVLIPVEPPAFPIGLDDPTLADKVSNTALHGDGDGPSLAYHVLAEDEEDTTESATEITITLDGSEDRVALPEEPATPDALPVTEQSVEPEPVQTTAGPTRAPLAGFGAFMVVALLPASFAAGAWHYSTQLGQNPSLLTPAAGVLGLLLSWLWIRWKYHTR
jgi:hypothetical protein